MSKRTDAGTWGTCSLFFAPRPFRALCCLGCGSGFDLDQASLGQCPSAEGLKKNRLMIQAGVSSVCEKGVEEQHPHTQAKGERFGEILVPWGSRLLELELWHPDLQEKRAVASCHALLVGNRVAT